MFTNLNNDLSYFHIKSNSNFDFKDENDMYVARIPMVNVKKENISLSYNYDEKKLLIKKNDKLFSSLYLKNFNNIDIKNTKASLNLGLLTIKIPKKNNNFKIDIA